MGKKRATTGANPRVGVFVDPTILNESNFLRGLARHAESHDWNIVAGEEVLCLSRAALSRWAVNGVVGFLRDPKFIDALKRAGIRTVNTSWFGVGKGVASVVPDLAQAGRMAAQFFLERGIRQFAYCLEVQYATRRIEGRPVYVRFAPKLTGFTQRLAEAGFSRTLLLQPKTLPRNRTWSQMRAVLVRDLRDLPKPVGVLARTDKLAARVVAACEAGRIHVPEEIAVIGYGNDRAICPYTHPPVASIGVDYEKIGLQAAELLQKLMQGESDVPDTLYVSFPPLIVRGSCDATTHVADSRLARALAYIERHACDPISIEDVLQHMGMNRRYLERLFEQHLHRPPHTEILRARVRCAQKLLAETDTPLDQVATACGFASYSGLSEAFRRVTGSTPRTYRKSPR